MYNIVVGKKTYKLGWLEENMIDNRKLKVYLDTSVISYLQQEDAPEKTRITLELWERFKSNIFDVCLSDLTLLEVGNCEEPKVSFMRNKLEEILYSRLSIDNSVVKFANDIVKTGILTEKSIEDCQHIAVALINNCDIILSWNFKHLVNVKTIDGVRALSMIKGYKNINILNPMTLLEMEV